MVRKKIMTIAKKLIKEDEELLRRLAEEHKYLKK